MFTRLLRAQPVWASPADWHQLRPLRPFMSGDGSWKPIVTLCWGWARHCGPSSLGGFLILVDAAYLSSCCGHVYLSRLHNVFVCFVSFPSFLVASFLSPFLNSKLLFQNESTTEQMMVNCLSLFKTPNSTGVTGSSLHRGRAPSACSPPPAVPGPSPPFQQKQRRWKRPRFVKQSVSQSTIQLFPPIVCLSSGSSALRWLSPRPWAVSLRQTPTLRSS